jgi:hypothetical protein
VKTSVLSGYRIKIVSGGQTGADRAALDFAIEHNIPHGGFCPRGRIAEDGIISKRYNLIETAGDGFLTRTKLNVKTSDATVLFYARRMGRGTLLTRKYCLKFNKPCLIINAESPDVKELALFLKNPNFGIVNFAGPRTSEYRDIYRIVKILLQRSFRLKYFHITYF